MAHKFVRVAMLAAAGAIVVGCATGTRPTTVPPPTAALRLDETGEGDAAPKLEALARYARNHRAHVAQGVQSATLAQRHARMIAALDHDQPGAPRRRTHRNWRAKSDLARKTASQLADHDQAIEAVLASPHAQRHRRLLRRALPFVRLSDDTAAQLLALALPTSLRAAVLRGWSPTEKTARARWLATFDALPPRAAADPALLGDAFGAAAADHRAPAELRRRADALLKQDPWHLPARLALRLAAGSDTKSDAMLWTDIGELAAAYDTAALIRVQHRHEADPTRGFDVALGLALVQAEMVGDARAVIDVATAGEDPEAKALVRALAALMAGQRADIDVWRRRNRQPSAWLETLLVRWESGRYAASTGEVAAASRRRAVRQAQPNLPDVAFVRTLLDPDASRAAQKVAQRALGPANEAVALADTCTRRGTAADRCLRLILPDTTDGAEQAARQALRAQAGVLGAWDVPELDSDARQRFENSAAAVDPRAIEALFARAIEEDRLQDAARTLDASGEVLSAATLTAAQIQLHDRRAGLPKDAPIAFAPDLQSLANGRYPSLGERESVAPTSHAAVFRRALQAVQDDPARGVEPLLTLARHYDGRVRLQLQAYAAILAAQANDDASLSAIGKAVQLEAPQSGVAAILEAMVAGRRGDDAAAAAAARLALSRAPDSRFAFGLLFQATVSAPGRTPEALAGLAQTAPAIWQVEYHPLLVALRNGALPRQSDIMAAYTMLGGGGVDPLALARLSPELAEAAALRRVGAIASEPDAASAIAAGREALSLIVHTPDPDSWHRERRGLFMLTGQARAGLAQDEALPRAYRRGDPEMTSLLQARADGSLNDAQAFALWQWSFGADETPPAVVESIVKRPWSAPLTTYACEVLSAEGRTEEAVEICRAAVRHEPADRRSAAHLADAAATEGQTGVQDNLFGSPPPTFIGDRAQLTQESSNARWFAAQAAWHARRGRPVDAGHAWAEALALGHPGPETIPAEQLPVLGRATRHREMRDDWAGPRLWARMAYFALLQGSIETADSYAAAAVAAARAQDDELVRYIAGHRQAFVALARRDLARASIDRPGLAAATLQMFSGEPEQDALAALGTSHPKSLVLLAVKAAHHLDEGNIPGAHAAVDALRRMDADDPIVALYATRLALRENKPQRARSIYTAALRVHPDHLVLTAAALPEALRGRDPDVPWWVRTQRDFGAQPTTAPPAEPTRQINMPAAQDFFVPPGWDVTESDEDRTVLATEDLEIEVRQRSRAARCQGVACARAGLQRLRGAGDTVHWIAPVDVPAGAATQYASSDRRSVRLVTVLPLGGRVFEIEGTAKYEHADALLAAMRLVTESFRPLDAVLPSFRAESCRKDGAPLSDARRLEIRRALAGSSGPNCPLDAMLAGLRSADERASALVEAWLSVRSVADRLALTRCIAANQPEAAQLGVLAVIQDDARLHRFGRRAIAANPDRAAVAARAVFTTELDPALSAQDYYTSRDLPPSGLLEFARALPGQAQRELATSLVQAATPRDRALGWALATLGEDLLPAQTAIDALHGEDHQWGLEYLERSALSPAEQDRVRAALLDSPFSDHRDAAQRVEYLAMLVASYRRASDGPALALVAARWRARKPTAKFLERIASLHRHEVAGTKPRDADQRAVLASRRDRVSPPTGPWRTADELGRLSLAELLPGRDWTLASAGNPRLIATTAKSLLARLQPPSAASQMLVKAAVDNMLESSGGTLFVEGSGLDLGRKIECANNPRIDQGAVCVAYVSDRAALLTALQRRDYGDDSGPTLPLVLARSLLPVPVALSTIPVRFHDAIHGRPAPPEAHVVLRERSRDRVALGPHTLQRQVLVEARPGDLSVDNEFYLFSGDRVFVFTTRALAEHVLRRATDPLASDPEFRALAAAPRESSGITAVSLGASAPHGVPGLTEIVVDSGGVGVRYTGTTDAPLGDAAPVARLLPAGATTSIAFAREAGAGREAIALSPVAKDVDATAPVPPPALLAAEGNVAYGWYTRPGEDLWQRWVTVLEPSPTTLDVLRRASLWPKRAGQIVERGGLHMVRVGPALIVASDATLLHEALTQSRTPAAGADATYLARGEFSGARMAEVIAGLPFPGEMSSSWQNFTSVALGLVPHAQFEVTRDEDTHRVSMTGRLEFALRDGREAPEVVDAWLAARDIDNALSLPRSVSPREASGTLTYVVRVPDSAEFAQRAVPSGGRIQTRIDGPGTLRIRVASQSTQDDPLSDAQRRRALAATTDYPSDDVRVQRILRAVLDGEAAVEHRAHRIVDWTHRRIAYEITPRRLSGRAILDAGRGDCSEYAVLAVTLLRAAGIPAEERSGLALSGDQMVAHAWIAYHDGKRWVEADPTAGQMAVSAGHLPVSLVETLSLRSIGAFEIVAVEAE